MTDNDDAVIAIVGGDVKTQTLSFIKDMYWMLINIFVRISLGS